MLTKIKSILKDVDLKEVLTKGFSFLILKLGGTIIGYLFTLFITIKFGANTYGLIALCFSIFLILSVLGKLGLDTNVLKFFSDDSNDLETGLFFKSILKSLIFSTIIAYLVYLYRFEFVYYIFKEPKPQLLPYLPWILAAIPFWSVNHICSGYLRAKKQTNAFAFFYNPSRFLFSLLLLLILYNITDNPIIVIQAHFFGVLTTFLFSFAWVAYKMKSFHFSNTTNSWHFTKNALPMMFSSSILILLGWMDTFVMGIYETESQIGIYNVSLKVATLASFSLEAINSILAPKIAKSYLKSETDIFKKLISFSTKLNFMICCLTIVFIVIFSDFLLGLFGEEFREGSIILLIFCLGQLVNSFSGSVGVILQMTGYQKVYQNIVLGALIINLLLTFILTPVYGGIGAAIATVVSMTFWNLGGAIYLKSQLNITSYFDPFKKYIK